MLRSTVSMILRRAKPSTRLATAKKGPGQPMFQLQESFDEEIWLKEWTPGKSKETKAKVKPPAKQPKSIQSRQR